MIGVELRKNKALSLLHPRLLSPLIASFVTNKVDTVHAGWERERCNERQQRMMGNWNAGLGFSCHAQIPVHNIIRSNTTKGQKHRIWWQSRKKCTLGHQIKEKKSTILVLVLLEREREGGIMKTFFTDELTKACRRSITVWKKTWTKPRITCYTRHHE